MGCILSFSYTDDRFWKGSNLDTYQVNELWRLRGSYLQEEIWLMEGKQRFRGS